MIALTRAVSMYLENAMCSAYPKESLSYVVQNACIITFTLAIPIVLARCVARWKLTGRLWADDYMSIAATVNNIPIGQIFPKLMLTGSLNCPCSNPDCLRSAGLWATYLELRLEQCTQASKGMLFDSTAALSPVKTGTDIKES